MIQGKNCRISTEIPELCGSKVILGDSVTIGEHVTFNVSERLVIGDRSIIGNNFLIEGRDIEIGAEFWSGHHCQIGGGSCFEKTSKLRIGCWGHLGNYGFINTADSVYIGNEVGMGTGTKLYTHGAYLSFLDGFPVEFGPISIMGNVWLPGATVLPNVKIGGNVVVGVGSVVTKDLPSGCLAAGVPARVLERQRYPRIFNTEEKSALMAKFLEHFQNDILGRPAPIDYDSDTLFCAQTKFRISNKQIEGPANSTTELLRNELRRYGVRFKSYPEDGKYVQW